MPLMWELSGPMSWSKTSSMSSCEMVSQLVDNDHMIQYLELVDGQPDEVHEVDQLGWLEVCKKIRHERRDELRDCRTCCREDARESEARLANDCSVDDAKE